MDAADSAHPQAHAWPPREGQRFFLLWLAIAVIGWIAFRAIGFAVVFCAGPSWMQTYWVNTIPAIAIGLAEGWLLFTRGPRLFIWALLPVSHVVVPYLISRGNVSPTWAIYQGLASIVTIVIASILLAGVRRRPWLWLFIRLGMLVLMQLTYTIVFQLMPVLDDVARQLNGMLALRGPFVLSGGALFSAGSQGLWLLGAVLAAAALAWWMPPVRPPALQPAADPPHSEVSSML